MTAAVPDIRSAGQLLSFVQDGGHPKYLLFWRHRPPPGGGIGTGAGRRHRGAEAVEGGQVVVGEDDLARPGRQPGREQAGREQAGREQAGVRAEQQDPLRQRA
jgi:hypothetical protein